MIKILLNSNGTFTNDIIENFFRDLDANNYAVSLIKSGQKTEPFVSWVNVMGGKKLSMHAIKIDLSSFISLRSLTSMRSAVCGKLSKS